MGYNETNIGVCFLFILYFNFLFSQDLDSIFNSIDRNHEESYNNIEQLFDFYSDDFNLWKDKVDLSTLSLTPVKAISNNYTEFITNREKVIKEVVKYLGIPYIWGGSNPNGFDCSGLIQWTIKKTHNILIPRTTKLQSTKWRKQLSYNIKNILPGDLIFFNENNSPISHVGIYLGDNSFIHAPNRDDKVKKSNISNYWIGRFAGFMSLELILN